MGTLYKINRLTTQWNFGGQPFSDKQHVLLRKNRMLLHQIDTGEGVFFSHMDGADVAGERASFPNKCDKVDVATKNHRVQDLLWIDSTAWLIKIPTLTGRTPL